MPTAQAGIAVTAPPNRHPTVTEYKYGEVREIIGKLGKCFWRVFSVGCEESWRAGACVVGEGVSWDFFPAAWASG
jgi:hypothetical protein